MRLMTKQDRENARTAWIQGRPTEKYKDIEILTYDRNDRFPLVIWQGTAGNPAVNYWFSTKEKRDSYIQEEKSKADRREQYKKEQEDNRGKVVTEAAKTSQLIKKILKKEYPGINFSVRSSNFAGGNSVDVSWIDGIPSNALDTFLRQFEYGTFDGMTDSYNYDNKRNMPQAKYVHSRREISAEKQTIIQTGLANIMGIADNPDSLIPNEFMANVRGYSYQTELRNLVYQIAVNFDFSKGFTEVRNQKSENGDIISNMFELY